MAVMAPPLEEFSADDLLFELRAREESERAGEESLPDATESDEDGPELNPELDPQQKAGILKGGDVKDANVVVVLGADAAALVEGGGDGSTTTSTTGG